MKSEIEIRKKVESLEKDVRKVNDCVSTLDHRLDEFVKSINSRLMHLHHQSAMLNPSEIECAERYRD